MYGEAFSLRHTRVRIDDERKVHRAK